MKPGLLIIAGVGAAAAGALYLFEKKGGSVSQAVANLAADVGLQSAAVEALSDAIATAEGFYIPGSRPQRNHNPGDMTVDLIGRGIGTDGPFIVYADDGDGWDNLKAQVSKWFDGSSAHADSSSTIQDLSGFYTSTEQGSWAANVARALGVDTNTPISELGG